MLKAVLVALCLVAQTKAAPKSPAHFFSFRTTPITPSAISYGHCGVGRIDDVRILGCNDSPCIFRPGSEIGVLIFYAPRDNHTQLSYTDIFKKGATMRVVAEGVIPNSAVVSGRPYGYEHYIRIPDDARGDYSLKLHVFQNDVLEICVTTSIYVCTRQPLICARKTDDDTK